MEKQMRQNAVKFHNFTSNGSLFIYTAMWLKKSMFSLSLSLSLSLLHTHGLHKYKSPQ